MMNEFVCSFYFMRSVLLFCFFVWKPMIIVYKYGESVFNASLRFRGPLLIPWSRMDYLYDEWMCFLGA